jgi:hypothetical protein
MTRPSSAGAWAVGDNHFLLKPNASTAKTPHERTRRWPPSCSLTTMTTSVA